TVFAGEATTSGKFVNYQDKTAVQVDQVTAGGPMTAITGVKRNTTDGIVRLQAANDVTQTATGVITASSLGARSTGGSIDLSQPNNDVTVFAGEATTSGKFVNYQDKTAVQVDQVAAGGQITAITGIKANTTDGTVRLQAANDITQTATGVITANALGVRSTGGSIDLSQPNNDVTEFAGEATTSSKFVNYQDKTAVQVDQVTAGGQITAITGIKANTTDGIVRLQAANDITQTATGVITANALGGGSTRGSIHLSQPNNDVTVF